MKKEIEMRMRATEERKSEHELCEFEQHTAGVANRMRIDHGASKANI